MPTGEFFNIPGNIKPMFTPFVLDPTNGIHTGTLDVQQAAGQSNVDAQITGAEDMRTQFFSFRPGQFSGESGSTGVNELGLFRVTPVSFYNSLYGCMDQDISHRLTYSYDEVYNGKASNSVDAAGRILNNIPYITIREYQQDAKLNVLLNLFSSFGSAWSAGVKAGEAARSEGSLSFTQRISQAFDAISKAVDAGSVMFRNFSSVVKDIFSNVLNEAGIAGDDDDYINFVLRIPHILYYKLISSTSYNIYEIPYSGTVIYDSKGSSGFNSRHLLNGIEGSENGIFGTLRNFIGKNIKVNTTPTWDGASDETGTSFELETTLFNDTLESAVRNFIFMNTIVSNNMWMQYHVFQHSPCLYDIRIEGVKRLYMCSGDITFEQVGPYMRRPPKAFFEALNKQRNKMFAGNINLKNLDIRIPDMYKIRCSFTSLLPNNFNNYLYSYYANDQIRPLDGGKIYQNSVANKVMSNMGDVFGKIFNYPNATDALFNMDGIIQTADQPIILDVTHEQLAAYEETLLAEKTHRL